MEPKIILSHRDPEPENSVLYMVGTPIGNLDDISARAIKILDRVSLIACEDTRQTQKIINRFNISNKLISLNKHNSFKKIPTLINFLKSGKSIALVSDAGMPGICDPGEDVVKAVKAEGFDVICIPGPCAAITALVTSGMPSSRFVFLGFLPRKKSDREKIIDSALQHGNKIDVLINNAGNMYRGQIEDLEEQKLLDIFNTNVISGMMLLGKAKKYLAETKGSNIFIGSVHNRRAFPGASPYAATKGALETLTKVLALSKSTE